MNHVVKAFLSGWIGSRLFPTLYHSTQDSGSGREGDCGPGWVTYPCLGREEEGFSNWVQARLCAAKEEKSPTGKSECGAGKIIDPHYNNERSPVRSQMSSLVTLQWVVSAYSHIPHTEPSEAEAEPQRTLSSYHHAPELLPALIHYTHHFYLTHQNMIYMVIYFSVLYLLPPPHVLYHLSWVLHQQQWTLRHSPQSEGGKNSTLSLFPPYRRSHPTAVQTL